MEVPIDTVTAVDTLIHRLNGKWEFVETGKAYYIGYTDDMYSIAAHGETAIKPLMEFLKSSATPQGKYGVVYTLHLIGINSVVAGRFYEEFTSKKARQALLSLLNSSELSPAVIHLLMRDPWQSDVPNYFTLLAKPSDNSWILVNALKLQNLPGLPIQQERNIPKRISETVFPYPRVIHRTRLEEKVAAEESKLSSDDEQILGILQAIKSLNRPDIHVENALFHEKKFWGRWSTEFGCKNCIGVGGEVLSIATFLENIDESRIQYYLNAEGLTICTSETARQLLVEWWNAQSDAFKMRFQVDKADPAINNMRIGY
ncbi:hypothetical protein GCM10022409_38420 [Hymenobacter glaciei]|uniref:Uncharacterized protein n=2 Tax=Hymenobacter glaciei TaxID=877209 RepID=A0ABP7UNJ8_9BACT